MSCKSQLAFDIGPERIEARVPSVGDAHARGSCKIWSRGSPVLVLELALFEGMGPRCFDGLCLWISIQPSGLAHQQWAEVIRGKSEECQSRYHILWIRSLGTSYKLKALMWSGMILYSHVYVPFDRRGTSGSSSSEYGDDSPGRQELSSASFGF